MTRLFLFILVLWPASLLAEDVVVKSGDHEGFSRLLLDYDVALDWEFGRIDGGYEFRAFRHDLVWDLTRTFDRISRTRIRDIEDLGDGRMQLSVDCDCHADVFVLRDGQVVIDIKDGPPPLVNSPFEDRLATRVAPTRRAVGRTPIEDALGAGPEVPAGQLSPRDARGGLPLMLPGQPVAVDSPVPGPGQDVAPAIQLPATLADPATTRRVAETEEALLEQIARAAAQGMIEADTSQIENDVRAATNPANPPGAERDDLAPPPPPPPPPAPVAPRSHVSVETGVDRAATSASGKADLDPEGAQCLDSELFSVGSWGDPSAPDARIGAYRSRVLGEFDQADDAAVLDLVRYYIYLTFGAEAKALMRAFPESVPHRNLLTELADIMDLGYAKDRSDLIMQMGCPGEVALWAVLAQPHLRRGQVINAEAVSLAFAGLPAHLRRHLGPGLAEKLLDIGDASTAERIRNAMARGADENDPALGIVGARLDLVAGNDRNAADALDRAMAQDSDVLTEAAVTRVRAAIDDGQSLAPDQISLLQSLAFEQKGTAEGYELMELEIRARAASGDIENAFARLRDARESPGFPAEKLDPLTADVFAALVRDAADPTFLTLAVPRLDEAAILPASLRRALAERFLDLGLAAPARQLLGGNGALPDKADRIMFARLSMVEGRPDIAIGYLAGLDDESANGLRARALEAAGDYTRAVSLFDALGDPESGTQSAWRGGAWSELATRDGGVVTSAAELMLGRTPKVGSDASAGLEDTGNVSARPQTPLARSQALVDQSRLARDVIDALLDQIAPAPIPTGS